MKWKAFSMCACKSGCFFSFFFCVGELFFVFVFLYYIYFFGSGHRGALEVGGGCPFLTTVAVKVLITQICKV